MGEYGGDPILQDITTIIIRELIADPGPASGTGPSRLRVQSEGNPSAALLQLGIQLMHTGS